MNPHTHRTIYNHARSCLMAVAETAKSSDKASSETRSRSQSKSKTPKCHKVRSALSSGDKWLKVNKNNSYERLCLQGLLNGGTGTQVNIGISAVANSVENNWLFALNTIQMDSTQVVQALVHENARRDMARGGVGATLNATDQTTLASTRGQRGAETFTAYAELNGESTKGDSAKGAGTQSQWNAANANSETIKTGNTVVAKMDSKEVKPLTVYVPGTTARPSDVTAAEKAAIIKGTRDKKLVVWDWSCSGGTSGNCADGADGADNTVQARDKAGKTLAAFLDNYAFAPGEPLILIGHSHGGNVIKAATQNYNGNKPIGSVVFLGTPHNDNQTLDTNKLASGAPVLNVYDKNDAVQNGWARLNSKRPMFNPNLTQVLPNVKNLQVDTLNITQPKVFNQYNRNNSDVAVGLSIIEKINEFSGTQHALLHDPKVLEKVISLDKKK